MEFSQLQSKYDDFYTPRFAVTVDGQEFRESHGAITSVSVDATLDGADHFSLSVDGLFDHEHRRFEGFDWDQFAVGAEVTIDVGYGDRLEPVLVGSVNSLKPEFPTDGPASVTVSGYGRYHELTKGTHSESWDDANDADAASDVAARYGFGEVTVDDTSIPHPKLVQDDETDAAFLGRLAERNDSGNGPFEVLVRRDAFHFREPRDDHAPTTTLRYGESLQSFSPEFSDATQPEEVEVRHWNPDTKETIVGSEEGDGTGQGKRVVRRPVRSKEEAEQNARAILNGESNRQLSGQGETIGLPEIDVGETIELTGLGDRFSQVYYVEGVTHRIGTSGYTTSFDVRLPNGASIA